MNRAAAIGVAAGLTLGAAFACLAAGAKLDVRTGLWQVTSAGEASGALPIPAEALARLPAEQRARIEASIKGVLEAANKPDVRKFCVTDKTLERGLDLAERQRSSCKRTVLSSTPAVMEVHMECTGTENMAGTFHIEAADRQTMRGNFNMIISNGSNSMTIKRTLNGKWLSADCGDVKLQE